MRRTSLVALVCAALFAGGCANRPSQIVCTIAGGVLGGAAGVAVSDPSDHSERAAAIGTLGALFGGYLGYHWCEPQVNELPTARMQVDPRTGEAPLSVSYRAVASDPDGTVESYHWDFGDGAISTSANTSHVYERPGSYTVVLTVTDDDGGIARRDVTVNVTQKAMAPEPTAPRIVLRGVTFAFDSADIDAESQGVLDVAVQVLKQYPGVAVEVAGHTDSTGPEGYNQGLSERRAAAVREYLVNGGVSSSRLSSVGHGESQPVADNSTRDGRTQNRRVELNAQQ